MIETVNQSLCTHTLKTLSYLSYDHYHGTHIIMYTIVAVKMECTTVLLKYLHETKI